MRTVRDDLAAIADAAPLVALLTTSRSPHHSPGRPAPVDERAPIRVGPVALLEDVRATLTAWVRLVVEEGDGDEWPADHIPACCVWLTGHVDWLAAHPAGGEFRSEIGRCWRRMRDAIGERPATPPKCTICRCEVDGYDTDNHATEDQAAWRWCACPACGATFTFDAALRMLGRLQALTVPQYAEECGVEERTLRRWVKADPLIRGIGQARGGPVYARADLAAVVAHVRLKEGARNWV